MRSMPGEYVRIAVIDTGSGMTREVLEHAFEPFFTTKEIGKGSGLGLAQVYGVATQFGGTVLTRQRTWRRHDGGGLPAARPGPRRTASQCTSSTPPTCASGGGTVLVVDDEAEVREIAAIFLREAGYVVKEAGNGPEARDILAAGAGLASPWSITRCR